MKTLVERAVEEAADRGLDLLRANPRPDGRMLLTLRAADGQEVVGQWSENGLRVQEHGVDPKLPALAGLVASGGEVVAHRAGRRAVVRHPDGWVKVFPKGRAPAMAERLRQVAQWPGVQVPPVLAGTSETVTLGNLPGRTLHTLLGQSEPELGRRVGMLLKQLHSGRGQLPVHDLAAEIAVTERWIAFAKRFTGTHLAPVRPLLPAQNPAAHVPLHRDLHDKQILLGESPAETGLLDLDLLALGEPALDLANLLVHLELRVRQGILPEADLRPLVEAVLEAHGATDETRVRLADYAHLTRIRLAAVYAFRPADQPHAALALVTKPLLEELA